MKKLLSLLLALTMIFSLTACGGKDDEKAPGNNDKTPSSSQQQEQETPDPDEGEDEPEDKGGDETDENGWPTAAYITDAMKFTGAGTIVSADSWNKGETWRVVYDSASVDEVAAYVTGLKDAGFVFQAKNSSPEEKEPGDFEKMFYVSVYKWQGTNADGKHVSIQHSNEPSDKEFKDSNGETAQLIIVLYAEDPELP